MKKSHGITLVSLVVTIIVLLILAGVTLALLSGSNGILGKAADAVDKNKVATAKEQVELKLAEFQEDFFEEKYVTRTTDGEKKEYLSEKLEQGVVTTNYYAKASEDGKVKVYEGKDATGSEIVEGSIQNDGSIQWGDATQGSASGGQGGSSSNPVDLSNYVTKQEYQTLLSEVEKLKNNRVVLYKNENYTSHMNKINDGLLVDYATSSGIQYPLSDIPANYKKLEFTIGCVANDLGAAYSYYYPYMDTIIWDLEGSQAPDLYVHKASNSYNSTFVRWQLGITGRTSQTVNLYTWEAAGSYWKGAFLISVIGYK